MTTALRATIQGTRNDISDEKCGANEIVTISVIYRTLGQINNQKPVEFLKHKNMVFVNDQ